MDGEPCKRCTARGEDCRFKIPLHVSLGSRWEGAGLVSKAQHVRRLTLSRFLAGRQVAGEHDRNGELLQGASLCPAAHDLP